MHPEGKHSSSTMYKVFLLVVLWVSFLNEKIPRASGTQFKIRWKCACPSIFLHFNTKFFASNKSHH